MRRIVRIRLARSKGWDTIQIARARVSCGHTDRHKWRTRKESSLVSQRVDRTVGRHVRCGATIASFEMATNALIHWTILRATMNLEIQRVCLRMALGMDLMW